MFPSHDNRAVEEGRYVSELDAREVMLGSIEEAVSTGRQYLTDLTAMNTHTPFKEPIHTSNLCLTGDTIIRVRSVYDNHEFEIRLDEFNDIFHTSGWEVLSSDAEGKRGWYKVTASALMSHATELIEIEYNGKIVRCTPEHKILTKNRGWVEAQHLEECDELVE